MSDPSSISMPETLLRSHAISALDGCPSKRTEIPDATSVSGMFGDRDGRMLTILCPKYPKGTEYVGEVVVHSTPARTRAAIRLGCSACEFRVGDPERVGREAQVKLLHEKIQEVAGRVYVDGHYSEAVFRGFVTVQEALRDVSGYSTAQEAIGKGGLVFETDRGEHVQKAHQQAAQFTLMAVDNMRNVEAHSLPSQADIMLGADYAYPRLMLCSLAMGFIDTAELPQVPTP